MTSRFSNHDSPLYVRIAERLREEISVLESGSRIPSEPQLARDWRVSRFTVAKAVERLVDEGLITRRQGSGSFVAEAPLRRSPGYLLSFTEAVEAAGHAASHRLLSFGPTEWSEDLPYGSETRLILLDRLRFVDGTAAARHRSVISAELAEKTGLARDLAEDAAFSLYRFFEENGLSVHSATERLVACAADPVNERLLGLENGAVVVSVTRHTFASDGMPLDAVSAIYDARRYSYEAQLVRQHAFGNRTTKENGHAQADSGSGDHYGPRLGPWDGDLGSG